MNDKFEYSILSFELSNQEVIFYSYNKLELIYYDRIMHFSNYVWEKGLNACITKRYNS